MNSSNSFSISFWLKKTAKKKDGRIPIYARIRFEGRYSDLSVHRSTFEERWCPILGKIDHRANEANSINRYLDDVHAKLLECHRQLIGEGAVINAKIIKLRYLGKDKVVRTLKDIIEFHRTHEMPKLAKGTIKNYSATETYLKRFVKKKFNSQDIRLSFIDYAFLVEFESFLRNCPPINKAQPLTNNGIMKHMERFKKLVGIAFKFRCIPQNPFNQYNMKFEDYDSDFLEEAEIQCLISTKIKDSGKAIVKDIFLFACYTGLSYIEVKLLKRSDIVTGIDGEEWINVKRKKTKTPVRIPLLYHAKAILDKYSNHPNVDNDHTLLPVYSNQKVNKYLKVIATKAQIDKHLTFHVARHTFATTITLMNNVPLETVSKLLGHTKLSTTQKYARVVEKKISKDMAQLKAVLEKSPEKEVVNGQKPGANLRIIR
ncbi:site-specific integrase [Flagellimonas marinaquae]|uniref:site-specific integrase n=1 Tax=Flagellimonas marinaquae TaxID=254955 RepID=UPI002074B14B|nr:site-specific integrase [Allomuricauda aquimarina]USD24597.1 site-specific integrase [Allomuricauda aquimarina]